MKTVCAVAMSIAAVIGAPSTGAAAPDMLVETPSLAADVLAGKIPSVSKRLPDRPLVVGFDAPREIGQHGGTMRMLMARPRDVRLMVVYGYARLVRFDEQRRIQPDILERVSVKEGRIFTLYLRPGHRWSDGAPFTSEDFRYYWEDIANNTALSPNGPPEALRANGALPKFEILGRYSVRFTWPSPNPAFLPALAAARPPFIYRPSHYLKRFHAVYRDMKELGEQARKAGLRNWAALHNRLDNPYKNDNVDLPSLQPWVAVTRAPAERYLFERNVYFHRVDPAGRQLPYIDRVSMDMVDHKLIPAKAGTGESDLQARYLRFDNYTFLRKNGREAGFSVHLWRVGKGAHMALYPNLNVRDPVWRKLLRDVRFRRALSLAVHRREINRVIYYGQAIESQNTVLPGSALYRPEYQAAWASFNLEAANALLDEMGLTGRDSRGIRLLPDGRTAEIVVETAGESTEESDVLQLVHDSWLDAGIKLHIKPSHRDVVRNRIYAGKAVMALFSGLENGLPTPETSPRELAPTRQTQYQWPLWGQYAETLGRAGEPPDMPAAVRLGELLGAWTKAGSRAEKARIWHAMLKIHADQLFTIGLIAGALQPVIVNRRLRNVPSEGFYTWNPGAHFGIYQPDTFWFDTPPQTAGRTK